jgi:ubiquinol-cytochrome c reductase cytochrome b subunit
VTTAPTQPATTERRTFTAAASDYVNDRTGIAVAIKGLGRKAFPDHWSFLLGEVALFSFIVVFISGAFLTFFFQASMAEVEYEGSYVPLKGVEMSVAMASTLDISFDIRGGLFVRQMHHWAALLFVAAIGLHMLRIFFTGAFRKPREFNWVIGFVLFILAMAEGFTGYSLPDDLLSGNGLRIIDGMVKGMPLIGTWTSFLLFGGEFPGTDIVGRLYTLHILLLPALVIALIGIHVAYVFIHKHTQFAGPGRARTNSVGPPVLPIYAAKAGGFMFIIWGVIALIAALFTINPIWNYGPYDPSPVSAGTQPDWYIGFADGALRLIPPGWEFVLFDRTWSFNILVPMLVIGVFLVLVLLYPFIDRPGEASVRGWLSLLETVTEEHDGDTLYICGHGHPDFGVTGGRDDVLVQRDFLAALLEAAEEAIGEGRTREEATELERLPGFPDHVAIVERLSLGAALGAAYDELKGDEG